MYEQGQVDIFPASLIPKNLHGLMEPIWSLNDGKVGRARTRKANYGDKTGLRMSTEPGVLFSVLKYVPDEEVRTVLFLISLNFLYAMWDSFSCVVSKYICILVKEFSS